MKNIYVYENDCKQKLFVIFIFSGHIQTNFTNTVTKAHMYVKSAAKAYFCQAQNMILVRVGLHFMTSSTKQKSGSNKMPLEVSSISHSIYKLVESLLKIIVKRKIIK